MIDQEELEEYRRREERRLELNRRNRRSYRKRYMRGYYDTERGYKGCMLNNAKMRAKRAGVPFEITIDDLEIPDTCPVLGIPLFKNKDRGVGFCPNSPSLDRINPSLGYVKGNVIVMSHRANRLKSDGSPSEIAKVNAWMQSLGTDW